MKSKIYKVLGVAVTLVMVLSFAVSFAPAAPVSAAEYDILEWEKYEIPEEGKTGDYVMYNPDGDGSDVGPIAVDSAGIVYASVYNGDDDEWELFMSEDDGHSWEMLEDFESDVPVVDIVISPVDDDVIFVATTEKVWKSSDAGEEWRAKADKDEAGDLIDNITSLDVSYVEDYVLLIGADDVDEGNGEVFFFDETELIGAWVDLNVDCDAVGGGAENQIDKVLEVAFSPFFEDDRQFVAVVYDDDDPTGVWVVNTFGGGTWGGDVGDSDFPTTPPTPDVADPIPVSPATTAVIVFPDDYDSDPEVGPYTQFIGIGSGGADADAGMYMVDGVEYPDFSVITTMEEGYDIQSLAISGDAASATVIAGLEAKDGTAGSADSMVRYSTDGALTWDESIKQPSGDPDDPHCYVAMHGDMVYAGTTGDGTSGFSLSVDEGVTFNQTGLMDTGIIPLKDMTAVSGAPGTVYLLAHAVPGGSDLWLTTDNGDEWERVLSTGLTIVLSEAKRPYVGDLEGLQFAADNIWVREAGETPQIFKSDDGGAVFRPLKTSVGADITGWRVVDESKIFIASYDDEDLDGVPSADDDVVIYLTKNGGVSWGTGVDTGIEITGDKPAAAAASPGMVTIFLSPAYDEDETLIASGFCEDVLISEDDGETWEPVNPDDELANAPGNFFPGYADPASSGYKSVFAGVGVADDYGIYRYVIDESTRWERICGTTADTDVDQSGDEFPAGAEVARMMVLPTIPPGSGAPDPDGTLYATLSTGQLMRAVYPTDRGEFNIKGDSPDYEVDCELLDGSGNYALWPSLSPTAITLWNFDMPDVVMMYIDTLHKPIVLSSPEDGADTGRQRESVVTWQEVDGADSYEVEWDVDPSFKVGAGDTATPELTSFRITNLESGKTYYWRVRSEEGEPSWSPWSEVWEFTTALGAPEWNPFIPATNVAPPAGASDVSTMPCFQWNPADWATGYEFILATDAAFANTVVSKTGANAVTSPTYCVEAALSYDTTYYWKVRAVSKTTESEWASGVFTTEGAPPEPPPPPPPPPPTPEPVTPAYIWVIIGVGAALVVAVIILIVRTRRPV